MIYESLVIEGVEENTPGSRLDFWLLFSGEGSWALRLQFMGSL